jgi:transcriptional regulator with XRE-family HTH domain
LANEDVPAPTGKVKKNSTFGVGMVDEVEAAAEAELPLESIGSRLRRAREEAGMSLPQLAAETRIGERMLAAIEVGDYAALPGRTYAIGFSRSYAKAVGLDDAAVATAVRAELAEQGPTENRRPIQTFEPGDPARVPSARLAWLAGGLLVIALILGIVFLPGIFAPGGSLPSGLAPDQPSPVASQVAAPAAPAANGPVVFTALEPQVWVKFTDAQGNQLMQKELAQGESWTVPTDKGEVLIWTARPDALGITIGGQAVPKLSDVQKTVKDVPVSAAALLARGTAQAAPVASPAPAPAVSNRQPERRRTQRPATAQADVSPSASSAPAPAATQPAPAGPAPAPSAT